MLNEYKSTHSTLVSVCTHESLSNLGCAGHQVRALAVVVRRVETRPTVSACVCLSLGSDCGLQT